MKISLLKRWLVRWGVVSFLCLWLVGCFPPYEREGQNQIVPPPQPNAFGTPEIHTPKIKKIFVHNPNGSKTPVSLTEVGPNQWRGPQGETYYGIPDERLLKQRYGLK